jgi:hypothetical protein
MNKKRIREFTNAIVTLRDAISDEQAANVPALYPTWKVDVTYVAGQRVSYNDVLYTVLQGHISQADWTPDAAVSLFAKLLVSDTGDVLDWVQPDSTNPYNKGDKVNHKGITYVSLIDGNVWEPGSVGTDGLWEVV